MNIQITFFQRIINPLFSLEVLKKYKDQMKNQVCLLKKWLYSLKQLLCF